MTDCRLLLIGPLPRTRPEGVSIAFKTLVDELGHAPTTVINSNWLGDVKTPGSFSLVRAVESAGTVLRAIATMPRIDRVYVIVSSSRLGFLRDALIIHSASLLKKPVICHLHGGGMCGFYLSSGRIQRALLRSTYRTVARIIVLGNRLKNQFRFVRDARRIVVVPNGLPSELNPGHRAPRTLATPARLLYLSNLTPAKGIGDLIESLAILRRTIDVKLEVCGAYLANVDRGATQDKSQFEQQLHGLVSDLHLEEHVHFAGIVTGRDKERVLRDCDVFILPTYYRWEGQPLSIIEAQAWGLPVVATDHRAIRDSVVFGQSAEVCAKRDPQSIADAVAKIVQSAQTYRSYSAASLRCYHENLHLDVHLRRMKQALLAPL